jgi:hypothetical protein
MTDVNIDALDALLPCPFCGESVTLHEKDSGLLVFLCPDHSPCIGSGLGNFGLAGQRETAIAAWNTRAVSAELRALRARVAELEDVIKHALYTHETSGTIAPSSVKKMRDALKGRTDD